MNMQITDVTGDAYVMAFDEHGRAMFGVDADELSRIKVSLRSCNLFLVHLF